jgi:hypothetical protein
MARNNMPRNYVIIINYVIIKGRRKKIDRRSQMGA